MADEFGYLTEYLFFRIQVNVMEGLRNFSYLLPESLFFIRRPDGSPPHRQTLARHRIPIRIQPVHIARSLRRQKLDVALRYLKRIYRTLLSRCMQSCRVYCTDEETRDYLVKYLRRT